MELSSEAGLRAALSSLGRLPHGPARCARAEEISAAADALARPQPLIAALMAQIKAYEYGAERARMPVPFARLLRLLDEHPEDFTRPQLHNTRWYFKWVTNGLIITPDAPLSAVDGWIREMERRYQAAGFSMRTVASQDLQLAAHAGDAPRLDAALERMSALPRDQMSDCAACEARLAGEAHARLGRDGEAVRAWSRVLSGELTCQEEPHVTLATALLPLLRLGEDDQARSSHLRGYNLARGNLNITPAIGMHAEFCALTGNEGRGLEIVAENWPVISAVPDPLARLHALTGVAVLLRRLSEAGHGGVPVRSQTADALLAEITPEITSLAARFDARNGSTWLGGIVTGRLEHAPVRGEPLSLAPSAAPPRRHPPAPGAGLPAGLPGDLAADLEILAARARELDRAGHPDAGSAWDAVAARAAGTDPGGELAGDLAAHSGLRSARAGDWPAAVAGLTLAARCFEAAGEPGRAVAAAARASWAAARLNPAPDPWPELDTQLARARNLLAAGQAQPRDLLGVRQARALTAAAAAEQAAAQQTAADQPPADQAAAGQAPAHPMHQATAEQAAPDRDALTARLTAEASALADEAREHRAPGRAAVGESLLAGVCGMAGDAAGEAAHLAEALRLLDEAQRPWATPMIRARLGELALRGGDPAAAAPLLEEALGIDAQWPDSGFPAVPAHLMLAQAYREQGQPALALPSARIGLARLIQAGDAAGAARARADLGLTLAAAGRLDEAAIMLADAAHDLGEAGAPGDAASTRANLGLVLRQAGDHRGSAEQFALAAEALRDGPDQRAYLSCSAEAALSLAQAGLWDAAHQAYAHALGLAVGQGGWLVRMHRELAGVAVRDGRPDGPQRAVSHIEQALAAGEQAAAAAGADPARARGITCHEAGRALTHAERYDEALAWLDRGAADLSADDASIDELARVTHQAAFLQASRLGQPEQARARLGPVIERCARLGRDAAATRLRKLLSTIGKAPS